jgi:hypothetical protein
MDQKQKLFEKSDAVQSGATMVDLLLTMALVAIILPFIFNFQKNRIERSQNIAAATEMDAVRAALERYIEFNKGDLLAPVGKNITRVRASDLIEYGAPGDAMEKRGDRFQIRVLKSQNRQGHASLQGIVVLNDDKITPLRTREIVGMGGDKMGFVEGTTAFGAFGAWHANTSDLGISGAGGIIETTKTTLDRDEYLWRVPSDNAADATMLSPLNLGGHDVMDAAFVNAAAIRFDEILTAGEIVTDKTVFQTRITLDKSFETADATVTGTLSSDSRNMEIHGTLSLADTGKFSSFTANDLWVNDLSLSGLSVSTEAGTYGNAAILKVSQTIDMVGGHISAMTATVGFTGSITPKLNIKTRLEDSIDSSYFWTVSGGSAAARLSDISMPELNRMATLAVSKEKGGGTISGQVFGAAATNKNATAADFMNAIADIQRRVRAKYRQLNLE